MALVSDKTKEMFAGWFCPALWEVFKRDHRHVWAQHPRKRKDRPAPAEGEED